MGKDSPQQKFSFLLDVSRTYKNKTGYKAGAYRLNTSFQTERLTPDDFLDKVVRQGWPYTVAHWKRSPEETGAAARDVSTPKHTENFRSAQVLTADDDRRAPDVIDWWLNDPFFQRYGWAFVESVNSRPGAEKGHPTLIFDRPVEDVELWRDMLAAFHWKYSHTDRAVKNVVMTVYNAEGARVHKLGNICTLEAFEQHVLAPWRVFQREQEAEQARLRAEREQTRLEAAKANAQPDSAADAYVERVIADELEALAGLRAGQQLRHSELLRVSTRLASLASASWHSVDMSDVQRRLEDAAVANGYETDYGGQLATGETRSARIIAQAFDNAQPADRPVLTGGEYFAPGVAVDVVRQGETVASGTIERMRQAQHGGHWEALVSGVWYPRDWLQKRLDAPQRATERPAPSQPEARPQRQNGALPPAPEAFPPGWGETLLDVQQEGEELIEELFVSASQQLDGRSRNVYAGLVSGPALDVDVPQGEYLTDAVLPYSSLPARAVLNANTGLGKTTYALDMPGQKILVTSSTVALEQVLAHRNNAHAFYQARKDATPESELIVTTYESFERLLTKLDASKFYLIVDEVHNFAASSHKSYRGRALEAVIDTVAGAWRGVLLMTGTPVPLCHPNLRDFQHVNVRSHVRGQLAQRVVWKDEAGKGSRLEAVLANCDTDSTHFIFLNDTKRQLDKLRAGLEALGFERDEVAILNSKVKGQAAAQAIIETERLPANARVLIATSIAIEALNLRDKFDKVHIVSTLHPSLAQQLVNRLRTAAAGCVFWYNAGAGRGYKVNASEYQHHFLRDAQRMVGELNALKRVNPNDNSQEAVLARHSMRLWGGLKSELVRVDEDAETGQRYDISYLGVDNSVFRALEEYCERNPTAYKNELLRYGWAWLEDVEQVVDARSAQRDAQRAEIASELRQAREDAHQQRLARLKIMGELWTQEVLSKGNADSETLTAARNVLDVQRVILDDADAATSAQREQAFDAACQLVLDANESQRKVNRTKRQLRVQRARDKFSRALFDAFDVGERLTSEQVQQRVLAVYHSDEVMTVFARDVLKYPFSKNAETPITPARAVQLLGDMYDIKRTSVRLEGAETPQHVYEITGQHSLAELVATFPGKDIKTTKVATNAGSALAFASRPADRADVLDWYLSGVGARQ